MGFECVEVALLAFLKLRVKNVGRKSSVLQSQAQQSN